MSAIIKGLIQGFQKNEDYGARLFGDLSSEQLIHQPVQPAERVRKLAVNHPAWVMSHLNIYLPIIRSVIQGQDFEDPKEHRFGMQSKPEMQLDLYPAKDQLLKEWHEGHETACRLLGQAENSVFDQPVRLERWVSVMPNAGVCLPYLMLNHENIHLGQISAWRRVLGMNSV